MNPLNDVYTTTELSGSSERLSVMSIGCVCTISVSLYVDSNEK